MIKLDRYEQREFDRMTAQGRGDSHALAIIINSVEGDTSQLSEGLLEYALKHGLIEKPEADNAPKP